MAFGGHKAIRKFHDVAQSAIEDIRVLAAILLVIYHVIGRTDSGMRLQYPHALRFYMDLLAGFRMPAFAFIAGFVFCLRPPTLETFGSFIAGKLRRLAVPGLIAALLFALVSTVLGMRFAVTSATLWQIVVFPYAQFWFLQAILVLFLALGAADAALAGKGEFVLLGLTLVLALALNILGITPPQIFSIDRALLLAPSFAAGMCVYRHAAWIERHATLVTTVSGGLLLMSLGSALLHHFGNPLMAPDHSVVQTMTLGLPLCVLLLLYLPHLPATQTIGRFTFTIYLYHVFATSGTRHLLFHFGLTSLGLNIAMGVTAGIVLPILLHRLAMLSPVSAVLLLGVKYRGGAADPTHQPIVAPLPLQSAKAETYDPKLNTPDKEEARDPWTARFKFLAGIAGTRELVP